MSASETTSSSGEEAEKQTGDDVSASTQSRIKTAQQIDEDVRPWVFTIKKWQFDSLITQPEMLLEEVKAEGETS